MQYIRYCHHIKNNTVHQFSLKSPKIKAAYHVNIGETWNQMSKLTFKKCKKIQRKIVADKWLRIEHYLLSFSFSSTDISAEFCGKKHT